MEGEKDSKTRVLDRLEKAVLRVAEIEAPLARSEPPSGERGIVKQQTAEEALAKSESLLEAIVNSSPIPQFVIDKNHKILFWNKALEQLTGLGSSEMIGTDNHLRLFRCMERPCLVDLVVDADTEEIYRWYQSDVGKSALTDGAYEATDFLKFPGKGERWLHLTAALIRGLDGAVIGAAETIQDISEQASMLETLKRREHDLQMKSINLEEAYTALKVLLQRKEADRESLENSILTNVRQLISPFLDKLEDTRLADNQRLYLNIIRSSLEDIISPFITTIAALASQLTPMELKVASLIRAGKSTKEIAEILSVGAGTVETHRKSIRSKLGLNGRKVNLHSYLSSLT
ncbi:MAG TPA: LuxR C-terminal-related transcriptional regulator [Syntrophorhabdaceae bacterium]|jgi:PAS domain-containing protein/DNA-binding CsgD family transcriptional regulator